MSPEVWGRYGWNFLHLVTYGYPVNPTEADIKHYREYLTSLQYVLPCDKCRDHMETHLKKHPLTDDILSTRDNLIKWGIDFHNVVNHYTGKKMISYDEAIIEINKLVESKSKSNKKNLTYLLIIVALLIICFLIYYLWKKKNVSDIY